ncbi:cation transporter MntH [Seminavis robusta]|uniref:Cation transporter MntH n=1 Tax=Seminavis robusta TaxID=568900 RepID=A0A9N8H7W0_9STRA|nr:cation transporter MntH [Seminavis robusta]|eukprot:Sro76_g041800.1 cation transporter MntH (534) ;mRNA; f:117345-118946
MTNEESPLLKYRGPKIKLAASDDIYDNPDEGRIPLDDGTIPGQEDALPVVVASQESNKESGHKWSFSRFFRVMGPGLMVCLADTDGPCLLTAAQSGSQYRYSLVLLQLVLIPILYAAQELTARLAVCTKQGTTALIRQHYGHFWAWFAVTLHVAMCWFGQASEFGAIGQLYYEAFGIDTRVTNTIQFGFLAGVIFMGRLGFRLTEIVGIIVGSLQLVFVALMFQSMASPREVFKGLGEVHFGQVNYEILLAGNTGAVIMPWMLYYQQSAVCERKIQRKDLQYERADTILGAFLAQSVAASMVVAMGSLRYYGTRDERNSLNFGDIIRGYAQALSGTTWDSIQPGATSILEIQPSPDPMLSPEQQASILADYQTQIDSWYTPESYQIAKWVTVLGVTGACTVASMVLTITSVWSVVEILDWDRDLFRPFAERPWQYLLQFGGLLIAYAISMLTDISGPWFAVLTQTINGLLILPVALFLWLLTSSPRVLPREYRLQGWYKWLLAVVFSIVSAYCVYGMIQEVTAPLLRYKKENQ